MRKLLIFIWLLVPLGAAAYHFGPGQQSIKIDQATTHIALAEKHLKNNQFDEAVIEFDKAIRLLPKENITANNRLRLEKAKAQMQCSQLPEAYIELLSMLSSQDENT